MAKGRLAIVTLGCKVNQCESEAVAGVMALEGWELVPFGPDADCVIVNTCVVTARAQAQSRRWICRARRVVPCGILLATGCFPQIDPQGVMALGVDGIAGNQEKGCIPRIIEGMRQGERPAIEGGDIAQAGQLSDLQGSFPWSLGLLPAKGTLAKGPPSASGIPSKREKLGNPPIPLTKGSPSALSKGGKGGFESYCLNSRFRRHTRAFLKIQDGCNAGCSYCIVPLARGRSRSLPPAAVLASIKRRGLAGYHEAVLAGIHLGVYGLDLDAKTSLLELLQQIEEAETPGRIRLSSLEPREATSELVAFISSSRKVCPHFHLPLQSGADKILKRMNRPYTGAYFRDLVLGISERMPQAAIGVDVMVGFPGEDEQAFARTFDLLQELPISYLHCFPFSPRPGTPAAHMTGQVGERQKKERVQFLRDLSKEKRRTFYSRFIGEPLTLLIEHRRVQGMLRGISRNYIFCLVQGGDELMGREVEAVLLEVKGERGIGRVQSRSFSKGRRDV
jgi:threonylcarbamoyladenosine tRNA methylthiotransferase MtaB